MTSVVSREGEPFDSLLKRFRKEVTQSGILTQVRKRRYFISKGELRRIKKKKGIQRARRKMRKAKQRER